MYTLMYNVIRYYLYASRIATVIKCLEEQLMKLKQTEMLAALFRMILL